MPETGISASSIDVLRRMALRHADTPDEADDLVQDMLLAALEQQRVWDGAEFRAWARGVFRHRALFIARTEGRRRRREASYAADADPSRASIRKLPRQFIDTLPPSLQTVALLANVGLGRAEIASLLGITDTALRQRISGLRRAWRNSGGTPEVVEIPRGYPPLCGLRRRSLKAGLVRLPGARFAIADPDGHSVVFGAAHNSPAGGNQEMKRVTQGTN
jgi:RNA polymerase sigma-70 factor (ECF subfamily)